MERRYKPREEMIAEAIRKNKEERSRKYTNSTSFKHGQKPPAGSGRKKGVKNDMKKKAAKLWKKKFEEVVATLLLSIENEDFDTLSLKDKLQLIPGLAKFFIAEKKAVDMKETQVRKIEVSFSEDYSNTTNIIDIRHEELPLIENTDESEKSE